MRPVVALSLVLLAACSKRTPEPGADQGPTKAKYPHPCDLLPQADAEEALHASDLQKTEEPDGPGDARCAWAVHGARGFVELRIQASARKSDFEKGGEAIPSLGDKAYAEIHPTWGSVRVLKGDQTFAVQLRPAKGGEAGADAPEKAIRLGAVILARKVADRL